ncbi:MAG: hybrid sensor histidine kinase/response regulator [Terriglobales bacterium]
MKNGHAHILLIEDNPGDADLVRLRLVEADSNIAVSCATRLSAGLASLVAETPTMVLLDLNLPDSHGAETYRRVLEAAAGVPIVVLSGLDDEEIAVNAVHEGVQDYLVKGSFDSRQLARAMRYAIERQALLTSLDMSRRQQLQFKNEFLSHVSHELRTPLTCIHQFVSLILDGLAGKVVPEQREHLETVFRSVIQLRAMITDLLEATRAESGKIAIQPQCVLIGEVIRQAVAMLQSTAQAKSIGLEAAVDTRIPFIYADSNRVLQVLANLLENAIKFTPPEGSVMIKAYLTENDPDFVHIAVADTGRGISPEAKALIFERLYQDPNSVDDSRKGLGLGLYIAKELVRLHGGKIWVESQLSHGSTFTFALPLFSLAKFIAPVITQLGRLREHLSLITLELTPLPKFAATLKEIRQHCLQLLEPCILGDKDAILPALDNLGPVETMMIVVSADAHGATIVERRIREQLERSDRLRANCTFTLSSVGLKLPATDSAEPVDKLVQEVADGITAITMAALQRTRPSN